MAGRRSRGLLDRLMGKSDYEFDDDWLPSQRRKMKAKLGEDMSKRITEKSNPGEVRVVPDTPKKRNVKKDAITPTGNLGSVDRTSDVIGPDMGRVNREAPVIDLSTQYIPEEIVKAKDEDRVDMHEQARRMMGFKKGGAVKKRAGGSCGMKSGGSVKASGASRRADGCAIRGKTKGRMV